MTDEWLDFVVTYISGINHEYDIVEGPMADGLVAELGIEKDSFKRCRAGIFYTLSQLSEEGHCSTTYEQLVTKCVEILEVEEPDVVYLPLFYFSEASVAKRLKEIMFGESEKQGDRVLERRQQHMKLSPSLKNQG